MVSTKLFTWDKENKIASAFASDLRGMVWPGRENIIDVIYNPLGLVKRFRFNDHIWSGYGEDRELAGWEYKDFDKNWTLNIYND
jgi:hypothetical protein